MPRRAEQVPKGYEDYERALAESIGARIRERRSMLNLSQETVRTRMELTGVHIGRSQLSRIEKGKSLPSAAGVIALADVLTVTCDWLLRGTDGNGSE